MSEEMSIERIRELRAGVTPADHSPLHHCTPLFMGEVVDFLLAKLDEIRTIVTQHLDSGELSPRGRNECLFNIVAALAQHHVTEEPHPGYDCGETCVIHKGE